MAQLKKVVDPFGEVNVFPVGAGSIRVVATILMEPYREGAQTGLALDGSGSMAKLYGVDQGGGVVSPLFAKPKLENQVRPVAQALCAYLARKIDSDGGTTVIYWATGVNGSQVEVVGDFKAEQAEQHNFGPPRAFGTGTLLMPAVRYFVDRFRDAPWGFYVFITDGELFDLEEVKQYSKQLARDIAGGQRNPVKFVLIGLGAHVNERQMVELDDLDTGTTVDLWDHKLASEMRVLQEIFAEVVDRNARVADNGKILDPHSRVVKNFSDTGLPAYLEFEMPPGSAYFTLEVNGNRVNQPLSDQAVVPPTQSTPAPASPAPACPAPAPAKTSAAPARPTVVEPIPVVEPVPVARPVPPPVAPAASSEKQVEKKDDDEVRDLELDDLARSITLEFEIGRGPDDKKPDIDLEVRKD